jgi:MFS transporter, DHA2 family, multidrug resistance protein
LGLIFVPLATIAYATLDRSRMAEAAGMYSLVRTIGASIGISIVTTAMTHQAQIIWSELGAHITVYQSAVTDYLARLGMQATDTRGLAIIAREIGMQSQMGALLDAFKLITWSYAFMMPLVFLLRRSPAPVHRRRQWTDEKRGQSPFSTAQKMGTVPVSSFAVDIPGVRTRG